MDSTNPLTLEGIELGRFLFYDSVLSDQNNFSCASCHQQQYAFSDGPKTLSTGPSGIKQKRTTPPLFNLPWYQSYFWDGRAHTLEEQAYFPVRAHSELNLDWKIAERRIQKSKFYKPKFRAAFGNIRIDSSLIVKAIAQFERTLISHNSKYDQVIRGETTLTAEEFEGFVLINDQTKGDCMHCHTTDSDALGTTGKFSNNGLDSAKTFSDYPDSGLGGDTKTKSDYGKFKIPSFRNVAFTAPYMHDGRFKTLEEVLDFYSEGVVLSVNIDSKMQYAHKGGVHLNKEEKRKIILFLNTLTDSTFTTNPAYSNPF